MTGKEIIIRLIDEKAITGEEAYVLLNAILQSELMDAWKVLDESKKSSKKNNLEWAPFTGPLTTSPYTTTTGITWTGGPSGPTLLNANACSSDTYTTKDLVDTLTTGSV